ncbi:hypothetical protein TNCV_5032221 [Trichonephila clavipes]|nr:hypothetical protein TNCV_5032221 [Trichonephila clavipes]
MPLRRFKRQYEQLSQFERGRIIGMMEAGWSARRVARQLGRSDSVCEEVLGPVDPRGVLYTRTCLRTPSTDQSSRDRHMVRNSRVRPPASSPPSRHSYFSLIFYPTGQAYSTFYFLVLPIPHGQPARGYIHFHLQPMREHPHSSQQCKIFHDMKITLSPSSRIPSSQPIACMLHRRLNISTKVKPHITDFKIWD